MSPPAHLTAGEIATWRLRSQRLQPPHLPDRAAVVAWLGGVQAQDVPGAKWSIGLRLPAATDSAVEQAVAAGHIVRTWAFRGTLHFVAAADLGWLLPLLAPRIIATNARRYRQLELDEDTFAASRPVIQQALSGDRQLVRAELATALAQAGISPVGQRLPYLLQRAALDGLICHGPPRGREPTYVWLAAWTETGSALPPGAALDRLVTRYFAGHGPATAHDFAWWAGLTVTAARGAVAANAALDRVESGEQTYWMAPEMAAPEMAPPDAPSLAGPSPAGPSRAYLLPPFDDYLLGYKDRTAALDPALTKRVNAGGGMPRPTILLDGAIVGTWRGAASRGQVEVRRSLFRDLDPDEDAAVAQAEQRYAAFLARPRPA